MDAKLTLKLDKSVIEKAKAYAADKEMSLSRLVENYFQAITFQEKDSDGIEITPFVKSFATGNTLPSDLDYKKEYGDYLEEKYK